MTVPALPEVQRVEPDDKHQRESNACRNTSDDARDTERDEPCSESPGAESDVFVVDEVYGGLDCSRARCLGRTLQLGHSVGPSRSRHEEEPEECDHADNRDSGRNLSDCHGSHGQRRQHGTFKRTPASAAASRTLDVTASVVGSSVIDGFVATHRAGDCSIAHSRATVGTRARLGRTSCTEDDVR